MFLHSLQLFFCSCISIRELQVLLQGMGTYSNTPLKCAVMCSCISIGEFIIVAVAQHENFKEYFQIEKLCSCITFVHTCFHRQIKIRNSITAQYFHIQIVLLKSTVLIVQCIYVSCHLVAAHETVPWECDRTDITKYL